MRISGTVLAGLLILTAGTAARAGIDFAAMPPGCSWTMRYSDGTVTTETYLGRKGGKHLTEVTKAGAPLRKMTYDAKGRMVRKDWAHGGWETFSPFSCFTETGDCTYRYRNADGADVKIASTTQPEGKGFTVQAGEVGGAPYSDEYFELGAFGLMTLNSSGSFAARLIERTNCDLAG